MRRLSIKPSDPNVAATLTLKLATEEPQSSSKSMNVVSQYLATIGRKGGIKGGKARAATLSGERRAEIARKAADTRWKKA
jgi:hypothetical protein